MTWLYMWIGGLACYRLTILIARCVGPFGMFKALRKRVKFLGCVYCVSIYMGALCAYGLYLSGVNEPWPIWIGIAFSLSGITIALDRVFSADHVT